MDVVAVELETIQTYHTSVKNVYYLY